jgi:ZIP family zinc transporter
MAIYTSIDTSLKFGSLLGFGVALHNIPLGMSVASFFYSKGKLKSLLISLVVSLSTFFGGLTLVIFSNFIINEFIRGIILSITLGMLVYIVMFELLPHILENKNKKNSIIGIFVGILILLISTLF